MKKTPKQFLFLFLFFSSSALFAQNLVDQAKSGVEDKVKEKSGAVASLLAGGTTINGKNFQQLGFRGELPIGKLAFGLDLVVLLDENGQIRREDWDYYDDYLDKIYYIKYGTKSQEEPFYMKIGGLDFSYIGFGGIMYGYSNMVEYPTYKRVGMEMAVNSKYFGMELIGSNFKELIDKKPSMIVGGRIAVKPFGNSFSIGLSAVGDINQYNGLRDDDGDGFPDEIDKYPYDSKYATDRDKLTNTAIYTDPVVQQMIADGWIDGTKREELFNLNTADRKPMYIWGADMGVKLIESAIFNLDIYGQFAHIPKTNGWGVAAPGVRMSIPLTGFLLFTATLDFRMTSDKFIFGYFNNTYELERAKYEKTMINGQEQLKLVLKEDSLENYNALKGIFGSLEFELLSIVVVRGSYQDMWQENKLNLRSIAGELFIKKDKLPFINELKAYYFQNDVHDFKVWKTPSTIMGYMVAMGVNQSVSIVFDYRYTFEDKDGDGKIEGAEETIKTFSISSKASF